MKNLRWKNVLWKYRIYLNHVLHHGISQRVNRDKSNEPFWALTPQRPCEMTALMMMLSTIDDVGNNEADINGNAAYVTLQGNKFQYSLCNFIIWFVRCSRYSLCAYSFFFFSICPHVARKWKCVDSDSIWLSIKMIAFYLVLGKKFLFKLPFLSFEMERAGNKIMTIFWPLGWKQL